jgi:hypothetical protein
MTTQPHPSGYKHKPTIIDIPIQGLSVLRAAWLGLESSSKVLEIEPQQGSCEHVHVYNRCQK